MAAQLAAPTDKGRRSRLQRCDESAFHGIDVERAPGNASLERVENESDALTFGTKGLGELCGHGHRMQITGSATDRSCGLG